MATQLAETQPRLEITWDLEFQKHLQERPENFVNLLDQDSELRRLYETAIKRIKQVDTLVASI